MNFLNSANEINTLGKKVEEILENGKSLYGYDYTYKSDTEDESKYMNSKFKKYYRMSHKKQREHILKLWKSAYNYSYVCGVLIT